ncbi:hypothetical protein Tco_1262103 [Tanacetum coccineum]
MLSDNHDLCVLDFINNVNARNKSKSVKQSSKRKVWKPTRKVFTNIGYIWRPTGRTFTIVGNACPLTRITTTTEVPLRKPTALENETPKPVVTLVYSRKPRKSKTNVPVSKSKAEAVATACYTQNRSIVRLRHGKTPYELLHDKPPDLSFFHVFVHTVIRQRYIELGRIIETIHVDFDELTAMASEHSSSGPILHEMTHTTISSGLVPNPPPLTPFVPPSRTDWDILFQPLFDELLTPPPSVDRQAPEVIALIAEVVAPKPAASTGLPSSKTIDQDAPSPSNSQTTPETQSPDIPNDVEEDNHDLDVAYMNNDPFFNILILENDSEAYSSSDVIPTVTYKDALTQSCWIEAMQEELNEFEHLGVWELVPRPDKWLRGYRQEMELILKSLLLRFCKIRGYKDFLAFAAHVNMVVYQMDVKTAFLNDHAVVKIHVGSKHTSVEALRGMVESIVRSKHIDIRFHFIKEHVENEIDSIKNLLDRFSSSKPLSPPIPKYQISVCLLFSKPDVRNGMVKSESVQLLSADYTV